MKTPEDALAWVRQHRIALVAAKVGEVPSLAHAVIGGPFKGSWWGHPRGKLVFALATAVDESEEVVSLKLIEGKSTWVHRSLWPELVRVLTDPAWRTERIEDLPPAAKRLYAEVERQGAVTDAEAKPLKALEASLLVHCASQHTEHGHHAKTVTAWSRWAKNHGVTPSSGTLSETLAALAVAAHGAEVLT